MRKLIVLYDGECGFCSVILAVLLRWDRAHRLSPVTIQSPRGQQLLRAVPHEERLRSWHLVDAEGTLHSGGAGIPVVFDALPRGAPVVLIASRFPAATARGYEWVAGHRELLGRLLKARPRAWAGRVIAERSDEGPNSGA
ncbi:MAG TPA: DCC1-like thiol-disulfide oxidoreductase family protein [Solirubrobacteraceae bacterium]|nr:DCC1-like thiol-disulfide oxidoreductase family protein [Solirubrobacteraceae bacterium]